MASASTIPPSHVGTHSFQHDAGEPDPMEFPQLKGAPSITEDDWEMVQEPAVPPPPQVKFQFTKSETQRQAEKQNPPNKKLEEHKCDHKMLLHSQSSPNLRDYTIEESESDEELDQIMDTFTTSQDDASSNFSLVSGPPSVNSIWSCRISFKDALLKKDVTSSIIPEKEVAPNNKKHHGQRIKKIKPKFIVQEVAPLKHAKSMIDLVQLAEEQEILGDADAHEYYSRKAQGSLGRRNGRKQRPDEKKRLQIIMNKKNSQRAQQGLWLGKVMVMVVLPIH